MLLHIRWQALYIYCYRHDIIVLDAVNHSAYLVHDLMIFTHTAIQAAYLIVWIIFASMRRRQFLAVESAGGLIFPRY